jgi:microcystin-dependent protein
MCSEIFSSAILAENIKLKNNKHDQDDFKWSEVAFENLQDIISTGPKVLTVIGGEPFYNKKFLELLESLPAEACRQTLLHIVTNCTQWNNRWADALKKFKLVRMMFSVDGTESLYEYIRYPAVWETTNSNIDQIVTGANIKPLVNTTVQNLNIGSIGSIIQWSKKKNLYLQLVQLVQPSWLTVTNLPQHEHNFKALNDAGDLGNNQYHATRLDTASPPGIEPGEGAFLGRGPTTPGQMQYLPSSGGVLGFSTPQLGQSFSIMNPYLTLNYIIRSGPPVF